MKKSENDEEYYQKLRKKICQKMYKTFMDKYDFEKNYA